MPRRGENAFAVVLIIFSAAALWQAFDIAGFSKWASPGVFPMLASAAMLVSAMFIFLGNRQSTRDQQQSGTTEPFEDTQPALPLRVMVLSILLLLYIVSMPTLGFLLCSGLFLFASISYLWNRPVWLSLIVSVLSLIVIHFVFRLAFQVILPQGTLITAFS